MYKCIMYNVAPHDHCQCARETTGVVSAVRGGEVMTGVTGMAPSILVSTFQLWLGAGNNDRQ